MQHRGPSFTRVCEIRICSICYASVNSSCAQAPPPPPRAIVGSLLTLSVPGEGHLQILLCPGARHLPTPGLFPSFWHAHGFFSENNYTEDFTGNDKHIVSSVKERKKLKRDVKACSRFYACIFSLLIKPESHGEIASYHDVNQCSLVKPKLNLEFLLILFEEHPFIFIKLFDITYNFIALY